MTRYRAHLIHDVMTDPLFTSVAPALRHQLLECLQVIPDAVPFPQVMRESDTHLILDWGQWPMKYDRGLTWDLHADNVGTASASPASLRHVLAEFATPEVDR